MDPFNPGMLLILIALGALIIWPLFIYFKITDLYLIAHEILIELQKTNGTKSYTPTATAAKVVPYDRKAPPMPYLRGDKK
jgi:hypothetical protein